MQTREKFKAVIFDLDGTLLYTLPDIARAVNHALAEHGYPSREVQDFNRLVGWGLDHTITEALPNEVKDPDLIQKLRRVMLDEYTRNPVIETAPYPGVVDLLRSLESRGVAMAILSNKAHPITQRVVEACLGDFPFAHVLGSSDQVPPKPDPTGINIILDILKVSPSEILYVGDTGMDMETAVQAGAYPVGVSWGYRDSADLWANGAMQVVDSVEELHSFFPDI